MLFKEAMSKRALIEYGNLGKLLKQGYIVPACQPDGYSYGLGDDSNGQNRVEYLKDMKAYRW
jgi:hypothetical protein